MEIGHSSDSMNHECVVNSQITAGQDYASSKFLNYLGNLPAFDNLYAATSVMWTAAIGFSPVFTITTSDADGDTLTLSLVRESVSLLFDLDPATGKGDWQLMNI